MVPKGTAGTKAKIRRDASEGQMKDVHRVVKRALVQVALIEYFETIVDGLGWSDFASHYIMCRMEYARRFRMDRPLTGPEAEKVLKNWKGAKRLKRASLEKRFAALEAAAEYLRAMGSTYPAEEEHVEGWIWWVESMAKRLPG